MLMFLLSLCILASNDYTVNAQALQNNASKSLCACCFLYAFSLESFLE